jgi:hypothetical protein
LARKRLRGADLQFSLPGTYPPQYDYNVHLRPADGDRFAGFLFISAAAHLSVSTFGYKWYGKVSTGINPARWYEYAISSSLMIVIIAGLSGFPSLVA